jgi:hypothetical protein
LACIIFLREICVSVRKDAKRKIIKHFGDFKIFFIEKKLKINML